VKSLSNKQWTFVFQKSNQSIFIILVSQIMADNLNLIDKDGGEKRNKLQQMDSKLKNMKNQMIEEAMQVGLKNNMDSQEVKDEIMSRLSAAYSLEKLRRALNQLNSNAAAQRESQKAAQAQNNLTSNHPSGANANKNEDKRTRNNVDEMQGSIFKDVLPK
jgi:hypothetical protein